MHCLRSVPSSDGLGIATNSNDASAAEHNTDNYGRAGRTVQREHSPKGPCTCTISSTASGDHAIPVHPVPAGTAQHTSLSKLLWCIP
jgi:hypothetical protein